MTTKPPQIVQLEMNEADIETAERIARRLGFAQTAYTSTSGLWGLFCLRDNPAHDCKHIYKAHDENEFDSNCAVCKGKSRDSVHNVRINYRVSGCIINTENFGFMFVADLEDLQIHDFK